MGRISRSFELLGASLRVLGKDKELLVFPGIAFVLTAAVAGTFFAGAWDSGLAGNDPQLTGMHYVVIGLFYYAAYFLSIFANAAVVACAMIRLQGGDPTVQDGFTAAARRVGRIAAWALVAATVGLILRAIQDRSEVLGRVLATVAGVAWSALTFFVVPVMVMEDAPVGASISRSARLFRERWGETLTGTASVGIAVTLIGLPFVPLVVGMLMQGSVRAAILVAMLVFGGLGVLGAAVTGIFSAALYRYAVLGDGGAGFSSDMLGGSFFAKGRGMRGLFTETTGRELAGPEPDLPDWAKRPPSDPDALP